MPSPRCNVRADHRKNLLYITLSGFMQPDEVKAAIATIRREAQTMKPGFSVINDIQTFKPASQESVADIAEVQRYVHSLKPRRIIRVTGGVNLSGLQLNRTARQAGYTADSAATVAEAERLALA